MKKFFQTVGIISLLCFSFIYTEKTVTVVKEFDDIMVKIKAENEKNKTEPIDATIIQNTIIPGISGMEINLNQSYSKMKRYGEYNEKLLEYEKVLPNITVTKNLDKYIIGGNKAKNMVSLIFLVEQNDSIDSVLKILSEKNIKTDFFLDGNWVEKNSDKFVEIVNEGHELGNLGYNYSYANSSFSWLDAKIKKVSGNKMGYCYSTASKKEGTSICAMNNNYTIIPNLVTDQTPLITIKENLSAGSIIELHINDITIQELPVIINFILSKGYSIDVLSNHLDE